MNISIFFRKTNKLIRIYHSGILKLKSHKRFSGIISSGLYIEYRLAVSKHSRIPRIAAPAYICKLLQNVFIFLEKLHVFITYLMEGILSHILINVLKEVYIIIFHTDLVLAETVNHLKIISVLLIFYHKRTDDSVKCILISLIVRFLSHKYHMTCTYLEKHCALEKCSCKLSDDRLQLLRECLSLLLELLHVKAHNDKSILLLIIISYHILHRTGTYCSKLDVIRI